MIDITSIMRVLPVSGIEPQWLACIYGFSEKMEEKWKEETIYLLEPPAGQKEPFIDPVPSMTLLFKHKGMDQETAKVQALSEYDKLKTNLSIFDRITFFDDLEPDPLECIPAILLIDFLRDKNLLSENVIDFMQRAVDVAKCTPIFHDYYNSPPPWSLLDHPSSAPENAMLEFFWGPLWGFWDGGDIENLFIKWRTTIQPIAQHLGAILNEPVYHFSDLEDELHDDDTHRFLVLHWCCTFKPTSAFVKFLVKISGAKNVDELKQALIDPESYKQPFKMNDTFLRIETNHSRLEYISPDQNRKVAVVFSTTVAQTWAESLLLQQINADVTIVAPKHLATDEWVNYSTQNCRSWSIYPLHNGELKNADMLLSMIDELYIVADAPTPNQGCDLKLSESIEELLWMAIEQKVPAKYFHIDGTRLGNSETCLEVRGVPERIALKKKQFNNTF